MKREFVEIAKNHFIPVDLIEMVFQDGDQVWTICLEHNVRYEISEKDALKILRISKEVGLSQEEFELISKEK